VQAADAKEEGNEEEDDSEDPWPGCAAKNTTSGRGLSVLKPHFDSAWSGETQDVSP
jgi:hypothetical protein